MSDEKKKIHYIVDENGPLVLNEELGFMLSNPEARKILNEEIQKEIDREVIRAICKKATEDTQNEEKA